MSDDLYSCESEYRNGNISNHEYNNRMAEIEAKERNANNARAMEIQSEISKSRFERKDLAYKESFSTVRYNKEYEQNRRKVDAEIRIRVAKQIKATDNTEKLNQLVKTFKVIDSDFNSDIHNLVYRKTVELNAKNKVLDDMIMYLSTKYGIDVVRDGIFETDRRLSFKKDNLEEEFFDIVFLDKKSEKIEI